MLVACSHTVVPIASRSSRRFPVFGRTDTRRIPSVTAARTSSALLGQSVHGGLAGVGGGGDVVDRQTVVTLLLQQTQRDRK